MNLHHASNDARIKNISIDLLNDQHIDDRFNHHVHICEGIGNDHRNQTNGRPYIRDEIGKSRKDSKNQSILQANKTIADIS